MVEEKSLALAKQAPMTKLLVVMFSVTLIVLAISMLSVLPLFSSSTSSASIQHVVLIMMEDKGYQQIIGNNSALYENYLASNYAVVTNYHSSAILGEQNYLEITSGSNASLTNCDPTYCNTENSNIFSLLQNHGYTWNDYAESMPSNCYKNNYGTLPNVYLDRHNPPLYYTNIASACKTDDVPLGNITTETGPFFSDLASNRLPAFSFVTPNDCNDMDDCLPGQNPIAIGDHWLSVFVPEIMNSRESPSSVIFITFDSACHNCVDSSTEHIPMFVVGPPSLVSPEKYSTFYNHYSTLATIEEIFHLGNLGRYDASATPMSVIFPTLLGTSTTTSSTSSFTTSTTIRTPSLTTSSSSQSTLTSTATFSIPPSSATATTTPSSGGATSIPISVALIVGGLIGAMVIFIIGSTLFLRRRS
jgi:phosphatidylinositol-3-phosphatase